MILTQLFLLLKVSFSGSLGLYRETELKTFSQAFDKQALLCACPGQTWWGLAGAGAGPGRSYDFSSWEPGFSPLKRLWLPVPGLLCALSVMHLRYPVLPCATWLDQLPADVTLSSGPLGKPWIALKGVQLFFKRICLYAMFNSILISFPSFLFCFVFL